MQRRIQLGAAALATASVLAGTVGAPPGLAAGPAAASPASAGSGASHAVFVENDRLEGNQIVAYSRSDAGALTQAGVYDTGGNGGQLEGSVVDHTASQGALTYDRADNLLLAANAGSNTISVFSVAGDQLKLLQVSAPAASSPSASRPVTATSTC